MASRDPSLAADGYEQWLTEKLWELVPSWTRAQDELAGPPGTLRQLVEIIGENAAELRRSHDRLWDDAFIELADPWAVPYLGDLVGTRLVQALLARAQRIDVAKTIYYRRRAGTLRVLEELIADITGWEGVVREQFRRLGRAPHGLDPAPTAGALTGTPVFGLAGLRSPVGAELAGSPFDELHHTPDLRRPQGTDGRYGINRLAVHLYRLGSWGVDAADPRLLTDADGDFHTFDPSGRDTALFARRSRGEGYDYDDWRSAAEAELPLPIRCRLLGHGVFEITSAVIANIAADVIADLGAVPAGWAAALQGVRGHRVASDQRLRATLEATVGAGWADLLVYVRRHALLEDTRRAILLQDDEPSLAVTPDTATPGDAIAQEHVGAGRVAGSATVPTGRQVLVDTERGRFVLDGSVTVDAPLVDYRFGFSGWVGAGPWDREQLPWADDDRTLPDLGSPDIVDGAAIALAAEDTTTVGDSRTYPSVTGPGAPFSELAWRAGDQVRPYLQLSGDLTFDGQAGAGPDDPDAYLLLDGLWLGAVGAPRAIVLDGDFELVEIRGCTLDPGGKDAAGSDIFPVLLRVDGAVERLVVQSSIVSRIELSGTGADSVKILEVSDSILDPQVTDLAAPAVTGPVALAGAEVHLARVTVLADLNVHRLWATDSLVAGTGDVFDTQNGCFRFSAASEASRDKLPHPYESAFFVNPEPLLVSRTFGDPGYAQLSDAPVRVSGSDDDLDAHASIASGAEDDGEMGAFHDLHGPLKERALRAKLEEYMPFGLLPVLLHET
ncbi:MAG: hypothetical protein GY937_25565 [bacterium]|nr:hypothetical protein [bacterium]